MKTSIRVAKIINIPIEIDISWLIIFALLAISLSENYFPMIDPKITILHRWAFGIATTLLFFASILIHELSHSYVAQKNNISIKKITLFIFGGVAQITKEPQNAQVELKIAVAGPIASIVLGILFFAFGLIVHQFTSYKTIWEIFSYLSFINFLLAAFNLVPAFPLDGGRIFRAFLWLGTKNLEKATRIASYFGQGFAFLLMFYGVLLVFTRGQLINGLWLIFIGWFLNNAATASWQQIIMRTTLTGSTVKDLMTREVIKVTPQITIEDLITNYFLHYKHIVIPVVEEEEAVGVITLHSAKAVAKEKRTQIRVKEVMKPIDQHWYISPETTIVEALAIMQKEEAGRLLVIEDKKLVGILSKTDILKFIQIKMELD